MYSLLASSMVRAGGRENFVILGLREIVRIQSKRSLSLAWLRWDMADSMMDWTIVTGKEYSHCFKLSSFIWTIHSLNVTIHFPIILFLVRKHLVSNSTMHNSHACFRVFIFSIVYNERF